MPTYSAQSLDGAPADLSSLQGKVVLLNVWATWCLPCRQEIPALQKIHEAYDELEVIGVSIDGSGQQDEIRSFAREHGVTYAIWHDERDQIGERFNLVGVPATFVIDREGVLRWQHLGPVDADDATLTAALNAALDE
jgi:cytochrome c-type biogenesis protein